MASDTTIASPTSVGSSHATARPCRCRNPLRDDGTCVRCGRWLPAAAAPLSSLSSHPDAGRAWTRQGVIRAIRTHRFFHERLPDASGWRSDDENAWPSLATVEHLFGSLPAALLAAEPSHESHARRPSC